MRQNGEKAFYAKKENNVPDVSIMIKPASSLCNMRCKYCFYHDVASKREAYGFGFMDGRTAEILITKAFDYAGGGNVYFTFQGGEPTLAGLGFFQNFVATAERTNTGGSQVYYSLQTNGTLINEEWCAFLKEKNFLVGLSLDGNMDGNRYRVDAKGENCFSKAVHAADLMSEYGVDFNILSVVTGYLADHIEEQYSFLVSKGYRYLQFIPCLRPFGDKSDNPLYLTAEQYARFLVTAFNKYVRDYIKGNYTSVRGFDNWVQMARGNRAEQCGYSGRCSRQFVVEANGNVYPCDFYCTDEYRLGNINLMSFDAMAKSRRAEEFLKESLFIPEKCKQCNYYGLCRSGGCKRQRESEDYCESYKTFFSCCLPLFRVFTG